MASREAVARAVEMLVIGYAFALHASALYRDDVVSAGQFKARTYLDPQSRAVFYVETAGRHLSANGPEGKLLWTRNRRASRVAVQGQVVVRTAMISNPEETTLLSSVGWVDHDALWRFDGRDGSIDAVPLESGARYASLHSLGSERFAVAHHFDGTRFEVSVRSFSDPSIVLARAVVADGKSALTGDISAWTAVPRLYVEYLRFAPWNDFVLLSVSPSTSSIEVQRLEWYDQSYDKGYQGVIDVLDVPAARAALLSVQRSSRLILHDVETGKQRRSIELAGRGGNPRLELRNSGKEVWASDYDTLVVLRTEDWQIDRQVRLQTAAAGTQQFIGDFSFARDQPVCVVARPFSGDVVGVDLPNLRIEWSARVGGQPLEVAVLAQGKVVARDWKTGAPLRGALVRR